MSAMRYWKHTPKIIIVNNALTIDNNFLQLNYGKTVTQKLFMTIHRKF